MGTKTKRHLVDVKVREGQYLAAKAESIYPVGLLFHALKLGLKRASKVCQAKRYEPQTYKPGELKAVWFRLTPAMETEFRLLRMSGEWPRAEVVRMAIGYGMRGAVSTHAREKAEQLKAADAERAAIAREEEAKLRRAVVVAEDQQATNGRRVLAGTRPSPSMQKGRRS